MSHGAGAGPDGVGVGGGLGLGSGCRRLRTLSDPGVMYGNWTTTRRRRNPPRIIPLVDKNQEGTIETKSFASNAVEPLMAHVCERSRVRKTLGIPTSCKEGQVAWFFLKESFQCVSSRDQSTLVSNGIRRREPRAKRSPSAKCV